jgi:glycerol dehydrogenase
MSPQVRAMGFPGRYIQGPGALGELPQVLAELQSHQVVLLADATVRNAVGPRVDAALSARCHTWVEFPGECSTATIADLAGRAAGCDAVIALGGGKTIDTGKGIARLSGARLVIVPTIASNDSPTSRLIVLYDAEHRVAGVELLHRNPDVVLVDTEVIAAAPARFFSAGMGDALSKTFEARQCDLSGGLNFYGTPSLATARLFADRCYEVIREHGEAALQQVTARRRPNAAVERVIEATVLLSGIGFESGGLSLAHALTRGFSAHPVIGRFLHGEAVGFGTLVQLAAEGRAEAELGEHAALAYRLRLPVSFACFGITRITAAELDDIARISCTAPYVARFTPPIEAADVRAALELASRIGSRAASDHARAAKVL